MQQQTLAGFEKYTKLTRRERFLAEMDRVVPWAALVALVEPHYPSTSPQGGRPPVPLERMLRVHLLQHWYALSAAAVEDALYDSHALRRFAGIDLGREPPPDATTIGRFRQRLEEHDLLEPLLEKLAYTLKEAGVRVTTGALVDATVISAAEPHIASESPPSRRRAAPSDMQQLRRQARRAISMFRALIGRTAERARRVARGF